MRWRLAPDQTASRHPQRDCRKHGRYRLSRARWAVYRPHHRKPGRSGRAPFNWRRSPDRTHAVGTGFHGGAWPNEIACGRVGSDGPRLAAAPTGSAVFAARGLSRPLHRRWTAHRPGFPECDPRRHALGPRDGCAERTRTNRAEGRAVHRGDDKQRHTPRARYRPGGAQAQRRRGLEGTEPSEPNLAGDHGFCLWLRPRCGLRGHDWPVVPGAARWSSFAGHWDGLSCKTRWEAPPMSRAGISQSGPPVPRTFWLHSAQLSVLIRSAAPALLFGLRLWAAVSLALYVAFWLELDNAYWA